MQTLKELLMKYDETSLQASKSPIEYPYATRPGGERLIRSAQGELVKIREEYNSALEDNTQARVFVLGDPSKHSKFIEDLSDVTQGLGVYADELYKEYTKSLLPSIGNSQQFSLTHLLALNNLVRATCKKYKLKHENLGGPASGFVPNEAECINVVRKVVQNTFANNLMVNNLLHKITDSAFVSKTVEPFVLVVMHVDPSELNDLTSGVISRSKSVVLGKDKKTDKEAQSLLVELKGQKE